MNLTDPATNRITKAGYRYDANGDVTQTPGGITYGYDVANRIVSKGRSGTDQRRRSRMQEHRLRAGGRHGETVAGAAWQACGAWTVLGTIAAVFSVPSAAPYAARSPMAWQSPSSPGPLPAPQWFPPESWAGAAGWLAKARVVCCGWL